ncbi:dynein axonemal intermediate chain 3-like [Schistocerca americana]|uniref:dynein axonemal intermediate chain 3-like n=1 Tax=Schistocerca americana TaxID=7009 RepID=UPI001F4FF661|nr:dynein axonemal intermediate chain 3-like [Schistocerca americana]
MGKQDAEDDTAVRKLREKYEKKERSRRKLLASDTVITKDTIRKIVKVAGVVHLKLSEKIQNLLEKRFAEKSEADTPWIYLNKKCIQGDVDANGEKSDFFAVKEEIAHETKTTITGILSRSEDQLSERDPCEEDGTYTAVGIEEIDKVTIHRRRYDTGVQAVPEVQSSEVQTHPGLPVNVWSQYSYDVDEIGQLQPDILVRSSRFLKAKQSEIEDALKYNEAFDHHKDDYQNLILRKRDTEIPKQLTYEEQEIFIDVRLCKGKIISCAAWHPKREGYFATAYVSNRPGRHFSGVDTASEYLPDVEDSPENIHDRNPVLLWSFKDRFHSKLTLLSPRPVQCLKFCPHNADILVGGLTNGQIVIWDLTENLRRIEGELDTSEWRAVERTSLVCRDGVLEKVPPTSPTLQFLSCSLDGHMYGWNLLEVPTPKRKKVVQKKSAKRPRSEGPERTPVSPYAKLHGLLQPHFKVSADYPISSFSSPLPAISGNRLSETDEVASTYGEIRPEEALQFTSMADVHDGPIEALERSHFVEEILISLGGRVFAIWSEDYKGQPLYWRQYKIRLTACRWFLHRPSMFLIAREDGRFETWNWFLDSCQPIHITDVLGKPLTGIYQSPINHDNIFGVADSGGTFRIFNVPHEYTEFHPEDVIKLRNMFEQHVECKRLLTSWTTKWKEKFADFLKQKRKEAERLHKLKMIKEKEKIRLEKERLKAIKEAELALQKRTKLLKWQKAQEIWDAKQEKRAIGILLSQKNLDNDHLETEQKPFVKLQEEQKSKRIKQTEVINMNESIYKEILSLKFPDLKEVR